MLGSGNLIPHHGQFDEERGAAFRTIPAGNATRVLLYDSIADTQAEAGSLTHRLRRKEGIEYLLGRLDSRAGVGEFDEHLLEIVAGANHDFPAANFLDRVHCVADQVETDLQ